MTTHKRDDFFDDFDKRAGKMTRRLALLAPFILLFNLAFILAVIAGAAWIVKVAFFS